ncbi:MAG: hypothetical protein V2B18_24390 [Pseudomonadota bacterium]
MTHKAVLSQELLARARVIAKGRRIRYLKRLLDLYGGGPFQWVKKSSPPVELDGVLCEYHWYEHRGIGRFEFKVVKVIGCDRQA